MDERSETLELANHIIRVLPKAYFCSFHLPTPCPDTEFYKTLIKQYVYPAPH